MCRCCWPCGLSGVDLPAAEPARLGHTPHAVEPLERGRGTRSRRRRACPPLQPGHGAARSGRALARIGRLHLGRRRRSAGANRRPPTATWCAPPRRSPAPSSTVRPGTSSRRSDADGNRIEYWVDGPGDDRMQDGAVRPGARRWRATAAKAPTQYAHAFWLNRARGELVIQYWFFYPFNEWINHHEGDWEHVNVVLAGPSRLGRASDYRAVGYEYYFHEYRLDTDRPVRAGGDHPMVFVGGHGHLLWWSGSASGGSYPWPRRIRARAAASVRSRSLTTRGSRRASWRPIASEVVMLPEPERLDARAHPELSWLRLPFFAGQPRIFAQSAARRSLRRREPPRQPARRADWNAIGSRPLWSGTPTVEKSPAVLARAGDDPDGVSAVHP